MRPERPDARWQLMRVGRTGSAGQSGQRPWPPPPVLDPKITFRSTAAPVLTRVPVRASDPNSDPGV
jgi:hypothetical protein